LTQVLFLFYMREAEVARMFDDELPFKVVRTNGGDEVLAGACNRPRRVRDGG
jgi:hypothetical protein